VLLTDIPGIFYGTMLHRADDTLLRFLPKSEPWLLRSLPAAVLRVQAWAVEVLAAEALLQMLAVVKDVADAV
jgi:hypothetical protein